MLGVSITPNMPKILYIKTFQKDYVRCWAVLNDCARFVAQNCNLQIAESGGAFITMPVKGVGDALQHSKESLVTE